MKETAPGSPKIPLVVTGITASLCLFLVLHIESTSKNTLTKYLPWINATAEIKLEATMAHLRLEKLLSGETGIDVEKVIGHLGQAEQLTVAMLDGNQNYHSFADPVLRIHANQLLYQLVSFRNGTINLIAATDLNSSNVRLSRNYDNNFWTLIEKIDDLESAIQNYVQEEKKTNDSSLLLLLLAISGMTAISIISIAKYTLNRANYIRQLSEANKRISEQNVQLLKSSQTDQLTGLPNRQMLLTIAKQMLGRVHRQNICMSLTFIDLDFFKPINDEFGHSVGDKVLVSLTSTIKQHLRDGDVLARLAGDEFILLLQENSIEELERSLEQILGRIRSCLEDPIIHHPKEIHIRFSAGTAVAPSHSMEFDQLLHFADLAMYESKKQGRGLHYFYDSAAFQKNSVELLTEPLAPEAATE
jgi:diguanylate cyclase (GGDEF)-like protein